MAPSPPLFRAHILRFLGYVMCLGSRHSNSLFIFYLSGWLFWIILHEYITGIIILGQPLDVIIGGPQLFRNMISIYDFRVAAEPGKSDWLCSRNRITFNHRLPDFIKELLRLTNLSYNRVQEYCNMFSVIIFLLTLRLHFRGFVLLMFTFPTFLVSSDVCVS